LPVSARRDEDQADSESEAPVAVAEPVLEETPVEAAAAEEPSAEETVAEETEETPE
jgi:hypothetical protein